ncbi:hypothetical protein CANARDRAFT_30036 [[Candida] arabinofermentans NRRL YB-2248]|uniref:FAD-binding PCMH-type domain-containing protein n=1 Tax=[Candida] arabinofermentans NRRL YB-2248 TaxID=983967 RepID=A0A1E4SVE3_9ASCO|nr:hypothetical protein CANARDRAFT_30036 [[Candida] arabinofermentans NRRL YB-2248]
MLKFSPLKRIQLRSVSLYRLKSSVSVPLQSRSSVPTTASSTPKKKKSSSLDNSISFQLFLLVGAMGAGYTLGKTVTLEHPPPDLFPPESITKLEDLPTVSSANYSNSPKFKLCINHIVEDLKLDVAGEHSWFFSKDLVNLITVGESWKDYIFGTSNDAENAPLFEIHPDSVTALSTVMKYCQDYGVPVYTDNRADEKWEFGVVVKFDRLCGVSEDESDKQLWTVQAGSFEYDCIFRALANKNMYINSGATLNSILGNLGIQLESSADTITIGNNTVIDKSTVEEFTMVLADGKVVTLNPNNGEDKSTFNMLLTMDQSLGLIAELKLKIPQPSSRKLIVLGIRELAPFNELIKNLVSKVDSSLKVSFIDNFNNHSLSSVFGNYDSYGFIEIDEKNPTFQKILKYMPKDSPELSSTVYNVDDLMSSSLNFKQGDPIEYYWKTNLKPDTKASVLIVTDDILRSDLQTYYKATPAVHALKVEEEECSDELKTKRGLVRRLKMSIDPAKVLNPNHGVLVQRNN